MDFTKVYNQLIERAKNRTLDGYNEDHHVIPLSMGGTDDSSNIVSLTGREHLIAHLLLWRIYKNASMTAAGWLMSNSRGYRINSRTYEKLRIEHAENAKKVITGIKRSEETRQKMRESGTGRIFSEDHRKKISNNRKGKATIPKGTKLNLTEEQIEARSKARKGKGVGNAGWPGERSEEYRQKISEAGKGHKPYNHKRVSACGIEYESAAEAARSLGVTYNWLMRRIKLEKYSIYFYL